MSQPPKFVMCLVSSKEDIICIVKGFCMECAQKKLNLEILQTWNIEQKESTELKKNNTRFCRVQCVCR
jgi:hypothetical protein